MVQQSRYTAAAIIYFLFVIKIVQYSIDTVAGRISIIDSYRQSNKY